MTDVAINAVTRRAQFTGNTGTGPFAFTFNILADADIVVYKNTTLLSLTSDYTISTNANGTGSVTLTGSNNGTALVVADVLTIIGGRDLARTTDFVTAGALLASSLNEQLDGLVVMVQQVDEKITRSVKASPGDVFTDLELPLKDTRKGKALGFHATSGDPEAVTFYNSPGDVRTAVEAASDSNVFTDSDHSKLDAIEDSATADQTASEILTKVKTVDGTGSGLDADLLDGQEGSYYTNYADTAVSNLVDSAPSTLDTLNELAAALGDDASFSTTVTSSIATKLPLAGGTMTGNIVMSGTETVDGRDLSADGDKLDLIEANATADQTAAEIRALVESASDSNVFTDGDHSKLNNIEANATADQTDAEIRAAVEAASDSNVFTDADHSKLDAVEANATADQTASEILTAVKTVDGVGSDLNADLLDNQHGSYYETNTANVTAAGALMDSELTSEASVKALDQGVATTDAVTHLSLNVKNGSSQNSIVSGGGYLQYNADTSSNQQYRGHIFKIRGVDWLSMADYTSGSDDKIISRKKHVFDVGVEVTGNISFEGATANNYETTLTVADPTADRTITLPDRTGEVVVSDGAVGADATALIGRGKIGYCGFSDVISVSHEDHGTSGGMGFGQNANGYSWVNAPSGTYPSFRVDNQTVLQAHASEIIANQDIKLDTNKNLVFEGATANDYETTVTVADPTADQTITLPNQTGTAMLWQSAWPDDTGTTPNYAIGDEALNSLVSGSNNVAYGYQALKANTTGSTNVAIGNYALYQNTTGVHNTAVGYATGYSFNGATGSGTYVGSHAGNYSVVGKDYQTAVGAFAMNDQSGDYTTAVGYYAMSDGDHYRSTAVGYYALGRSSTGSPWYNTAVGQQSGNSIWSGDGNTLVGHDTDTYTWSTSYGVAVGYQPRAGTYGVSIGYQAAYSQSADSNWNICIGQYAGYDIDGGDYCTFIGSSAGYEGGTGNANASVGANSLRSLSSGTHNNALGYWSLYDVTSGDYNSSLGSYSGHELSTGSNNTLLGYNAGYKQGISTTNALTTGSNVTCVGFEAMPSSGTATNEIVLGDASISYLRCNVQTISSLSDERDKTAIADLTYGLDFINDMRPVEFTWNRRDGTLGAKPDMGFIAQELYDTELDHSSSSRTRLVNWENPEKLEADYVRSYPILVKAVQQLSAQVTALQARIETLEGN
jgi:hypothetical protein